MVSVREVNKQLKKTGYYYHFWMRKEIRELSKVLDDNEAIKQCVNGYYKGGLALLAATDRRLLLIDCKPMYLTLEVIWYDKIGQIDYNHRLLNATVCVSTPNKELNFTSYNIEHLRQAVLYTQVKVAEAEAPERGEEKASKTNFSFHGQSASNSAGTLASASTQPVFVNSQPSLLPADRSDIPNTNLKLASSRLPFSRRRYFAEQESEPLEI